METIFRWILHPSYGVPASLLSLGLCKTMGTLLQHPADFQGQVLASLCPKALFWIWEHVCVSPRWQTINNPRSFSSQATLNPESSPSAGDVNFIPFPQIFCFPVMPPQLSAVVTCSVVLAASLSLYHIPTPSWNSLPHPNKLLDLSAPVRVTS